MAILFIVTILSLFCSTVLVIGTFRTFQIQSAPEQKIFLAGDIPQTRPDGDYKGSIKNMKTGWQGKSFDVKTASGSNRFKENGKTVNKYPFRTYTSGGIQDKNKKVVKIDYNISGNPWWLRLILDEVVETKPNNYLGKVHVRIFPGAAFTLGYFELKQ